MTCRRSFRPIHARAGYYQYLLLLLFVSYLDNGGWVTLSVIFFFFTCMNPNRAPPLSQQCLVNKERYQEDGFPRAKFSALVVSVLFRYSSRSTVVRCITNYCKKCVIHSLIHAISTPQNVCALCKNNAGMNSLSLISDVCAILNLPQISIDNSCLFCLNLT